MQKFVLSCVAVFLSTFAVPALADTNGSTSQGVQMQAGPGTEYPEVMRLAPNLKVTIHGCARAWDWCDVEWRGNRGWVPAASLDYRLDRTLLPIANYGPRIGIPEIGFDLSAYWETHYQQRPWYADRQEWAARAKLSSLAQSN
jgi:uncharacterized protein YraI